ncbi:MBL fold metallo-hydrolase [Sporosarcina sp. P2]|uniref:MBL fold metallo-hydrolase n=1 Tax=Sporosarcina sp. P2 TaxID=2048251 RepID=UPI000C16D25A|nr:MBL fold metallo-hydrolase [Sporosarcina sp. P2]PID03058.1 MBL fold metallo-hydrolase [Sporosarcina sp. P2]
MKRSSSTDRILPVTSFNSGDVKEIAEGIYCYTVQIVNVFFIRNQANPNEWILIDAGMPASGGTILEKAEELFGKDCKLKEIILTHGHFDHIGGIIDILEKQPVPVYAHPLEMPFLSGEKDYPKPDSSVEGGAVAKMSGTFPIEAIDISEYLHSLPEDGTIPMLSGWRWIHTPGHAPGHISLFREQDRLLLAGDAFVTVQQDSLYKVLTQKQEIHGPPVYLTTDWKASKASVQTLANLRPVVAGTGHGSPVSGTELIEGLNRLAADFEELAVPDHGRFVDDEK